MSAVIWAIIAVVVLFLIIVFSRLAVVMKSKKGSDGAKKEKVVKEKKTKEKKEKKAKEKKEKKVKEQKNNLRPSDIAWARLKEKQKKEAELKAQEKAKKQKTLEEGESDNPNFEDDSSDDEEKVEEAKGLTTEKTSELADEFKELSPEMKALLVGDVLDKKN